MPKAKKGSKKQQLDSDSDADIIDPIKAAAKAAEDDEDPVKSLPAAPPKQKKAKKKKGKQNRDEDSDDEDIEKKIAELALNADDAEEDVPKPKSKKSAKKKPQAVSAFAMLDMDDGGSEDDKSVKSDESEPEPEETPEPVKPTKEKKNKKKKGKQQAADDEDIDDLVNSMNGGSTAADRVDDTESRLAALPADSGDEGSKSKSKKDKKKKKKGKGKATAEEEEDLDALLAEFGDKKTEPAAESSETAAAPADEGTAEAGEGEEHLSAAQKKKLKKQKQKERKDMEEAGLLPPPAADKQEGEEPAAEGDDEKKKKKKKKDKKSAEQTETVDEKKKPKNKQLAAMKEALARAKEDQERMEREEEEKIARQKEAIRIRDEEKKMKDEQRRKQREKEKERLERKKKEGTLLTPQQKLAQERARQMLEARGIQLPKAGEKLAPKKPYYGKPKKNKQPPKSATADKTPTEEQPRPLDTPTTPTSEGKEDAPAAWDADLEVKEEVKDDWEASSEDEAPDSKTEATPAAIEEVKPPTPEVAAADEAAEESEESSDEESSDEDSSSEESSSEDDDDMTPRERAFARIQKRASDAEAKKSTDVLRAPVVCVLGHVDTGKTKILDKLRRTNVQDGEAGGITQQIGATNVPLDAIHKQTSFVKDFDLAKLKVPGLLIIDTPGHESFSNLRTRGSSLCDIAILVIDIMHGLEPQTIESIQLLKKGKTPFIVALNKIDRLYNWKTNAHKDVHAVIKSQSSNTKTEFDERASLAITQLAEQGLNAALFYENPNPKEYISLVPTSAHSGDGMGNLIALLCHYSQTFLAKRVAVTDDLQATVMEVKALPGLGTTVDVILVNGRLRNGDVVVMPGTEGPIVTHIRELLMPEPMRELRVKSAFRHHKEVEAAQGVKIVGKELDKVMAGLPMYVAKYQDEVEVYKEWIAAALKNALNAIKLSSTGVFVQASTLGSMEALLEYLRSVKVPYAGINIGPVHKKDVMRASVMVEHSEPQYATILAFDVKVERDANELADNLGVKIFTADIIYHLFDSFSRYQEELIEKGRRENNHLKIFPCKLRVLPQFIFNSRDPIIMGVCVEAGFLSTGTPICVPSKEFTQLGVVTSVEKESKPVERATKGMEICIKIENLPGQAPRLYGRHFDETDMLVSKISRESIDAVKKYWKKDMSKDDWKLVIELKKTFEIM